MVVEIRIYKRYDIDLFSLCDAGFPVVAMMKDAISGYANVTPVHFLIDEAVPFNLEGKTSIHKRLNIPDDDVKTITLLKNVKKGLRNNFCKNVLRNALIQQNLCGYFDTDNEKYIKLQNANLSLIDLSAYKNVIPCSQLRRNKQFTFLGKTYVKENVKGFKLNEDKPIMEDVNSIKNENTVREPVKKEYVEEIIEEPINIFSSHIDLSGIREAEYINKPSSPTTLNDSRKSNKSNVAENGALTSTDDKLNDDFMKMFDAL